MNELLLNFARWLDTHAWSTALHESIYMYSWVETTHVLSLTLFLGMLFIIDLRMLGWVFPQVPATTIAARLDRPMMIGFVAMIVTGVLLYYAIPVRTTQSVWFRIKVVALVFAAINAFMFRRHMQASGDTWANQPKAPSRFRWGAGISLSLWAIVVVTGRTIAYDWFDCHKQLSSTMYWVAGCVDELASLP